MTELEEDMKRLGELISDVKKQVTLIEHYYDMVRYYFIHKDLDDEARAHQIAYEEAIYKKRTIKCDLLPGAENDRIYRKNDD
jgi:hypothetical protein